MTDSYIKEINNYYNKWIENNKQRIEKNEKDPLIDFLESNINDEWMIDELKKDKYPIICFYDYDRLSYSIVTGKQMGYGCIRYLNLQQFGYVFTFDQLSKMYKVIDNLHDYIIYPPKGKSFKKEQTQLDIQAEFLRELIVTKNNGEIYFDNKKQPQAAKKILSKYGKKYSSLGSSI